MFGIRASRLVFVVLLLLPACAKERAAAEPEYLETTFKTRAFVCNGSCSMPCAGNVCTCQIAESARGDAYEKLQACIDGTPEGGTLRIPPGAYQIQRTLRIEKRMTIESATAEPDCRTQSACATLFASPDFSPMVDPRNTRYRDGGLIWALGRTAAISGVVVNKMVLDANKNGRYAAGNVAACKSSDARERFAGKVIRFGHHEPAKGVCNDCRLTNSLVGNGLCTGAVVLSGDRIVVQNTYVLDTGWSRKDGSSQFRGDGIAVNSGEGIQLLGNYIQDASDIGIMMQSGRGIIVRQNMIRQNVNNVAHGIHLHNGGGAGGDFQGARVESNLVYCATAEGKAACDVGIMVGPRSFRSSCGNGGCRIQGGVVQANQVVSARVGILVDGVQDGPNERSYVVNNQVGQTPAAGSSEWYCRERGTNLNTDDFVVGDYAGATPLTQYRVSSEYTGLCQHQ